MSRAMIGGISVLIDGEKVVITDGVFYKPQICVF